MISLPETIILLQCIEYGDGLVLSCNKPTSDLSYIKFIVLYNAIRGQWVGEG